MARKHLPASNAVLFLITALEPAETEALALQSTDAIAFILESWQTLRYRRHYRTHKVICTRAAKAARQAT